MPLTFENIATILTAVLFTAPFVALILLLWKKLPAFVNIIYAAFIIVFFIASMAVVDYRKSSNDNEIPITLTSNEIDVLALGDSVAAGMMEGLHFSSFMGASEEFAMILETLGNDGWYQNWSISGATSENTLSMIQNNTTSEEYIEMITSNFEDWNNISGHNDDPTERVAKIMPDTDIKTLIADAEVIYINVSGNDVLVNTVLGLNFDDVQANLDIMKQNIIAIVEEINSINPNAEIYINQVFTPNMKLPIVQDYQVVADILNDTLISVAQYYKNVYIIPTVNTVVPFQLQTQQFSDVHPSEQGYNYLTFAFLYSFYLNSQYIQ